MNDFDQRLLELQAAHDAAAAAVGDFEAEFAASEGQWKERRKAVNDAYKAAESALQSYVNDRRAIPDVAPTEINPEGIGQGTEGGVG